MTQPTMTTPTQPASPSRAEAWAIIEHAIAVSLAYDDLAIITLRMDAAKRVLAYLASQPVGRAGLDPQLAEFYQVDNVPALLDAMNGHIERLQDKLRRQVPWDHGLYPPDNAAPPVVEGAPVAWRYMKQLSGAAFVWTRWLDMNTLVHYGPDGNAVKGPAPDWKIEYAYAALAHPNAAPEQEAKS